ncbi:MAG: LptF/LptG family permease [Terrimonas sp.]|mgnify:CR=1 FL=1|uniref:LptF/LptG family permease n=1 Tax=Terrimonas sp. TaxID=1914338 RepID=UPI00092AB1D4|nr:LptF/LptG family permease [Terrimonas sp.]MBN8789127.1 LptF/LptG family permease [Terrimonas sp.]OJY92968.1 MAG: permease [Sphingobacteriales bacterium 40-81]PVD54171.1 permease [Terrimonas sp.]
MKKIDWYIFKDFILTFVFCILLFTVISVVVDISEKTDDFARSNLSAGFVLKNYYVGFVPFIVSFLFPLFTFIAVIFFTSKLANRSEIIAILASGTSFNRLLKPYIIGGILLSLLLWIGNRKLVPRANEIRTAFELKYVKAPGMSSANNNIYMRIDSNSYCGIRYYDTTAKSGNGFFMDRLKGNQVIYNLRADKIEWEPKDKKWKLSGVIERHINGLHEDVKQDTVRRIDLKFAPVDLRRDEYVKSRLSTRELNQMVNMEKLRGSEGINDLEVELYRRDATPVTVLILTLIGAILASRKIRGGSGIHLAAGFAIAALFILLDRFSTIFSVKGNLPPILAAWIPNVLFGILTYYLYRKAPK